MLHLKKCVLLSVALATPAATFFIARAGSPAEPETAVTLGQAFMGPVGTSTAFTSVLVTNRDLSSCEVGLKFSRGAATAPPISINGEIRADNAFSFSVARGGVEIVQLTSEILTQGVAAISVSPPCSRGSISVSATYLIRSREGLLTEAFTIPANDSATWLTKDRCNAISAVFDPEGINGIPSDLGIATSSVTPGEPAPEGTFLSVRPFDAAGSPLADVRTLEVTGLHSPIFPLDAFSELEEQNVTVLFCLETNEREKSYRLDLTPVGVRGTPLDVQFETPVFADGFESGDTSAWSN